MKKANDLIAGLTHVRERRLDLLALEALDHVLADLFRLRLDAEREHPAAGLLEAVDEGRIRQVVGARVAEPLDRQVARDELVAERRERLDVQRDRVAPQIEELHAELAIGSLDLVDQHLGAALAELVALVDRRDAEIAGVGTAAAGFDEHVRLVDERQRVVLERQQVPRRARASAGTRRTGRARDAASTVPFRRNVRLGTSRRRSSESSAASASAPLPARRRTCRRRPARAASTRRASSTRAARSRTSARRNALFSFAISTTSASSVGVVVGNTMSVGAKPSRFQPRR